MSELTDSVAGLSREEALEAARFLAEQLGVEPTSGSEAAVHSLTDQPYANIEAIEELARLTLLSAAIDPDLEPAVRAAIEGAGRKQFIFGGAELVALAAVALSALHVVITKGKTSETHTVTIEERDGATVTTHKDEVTFGVGGKLAAILKSYFVA